MPTMWRICWDSKDKKFGYQGEPIYSNQEIATAVAAILAQSRQDVVYRVESVEIQSRR